MEKNEKTQIYGKEQVKPRLEAASWGRKSTGDVTAGANARAKVGSGYFHIEKV